MTQDIARLGIEIDARQVRDGDRALNDFARTGARTEQQVDRTSAAMARMARMAQTVAAALATTVGVSKVLEMVDAYSKFTSQLSLATQSQREYAAAYADVVRISRVAQQGLGETGILYAKIANGTRELGTTQKQVAAITETVNLALKVSGATANEAASAQLQLSQAFSAGALRGEEFNAVNEAAPRLMLALADGIGVPVGALKKMAEEGKITSAIMADVLPKALEKVREEAKQIQTIGGALTVLKNSAMEFFGIQAKESGAVSALTGAIGALANNLGLVAGAVLTLTAAKFGTWIATMIKGAVDAATANRALALSNLATAQSNATATASASLLANARLAEVRASALAATGATQLAITTNGLIPAQTRAAAAAGAHTAAMVALAAAQRAASVSGGIAAGVLTALGGPVGAVITVLGIAATAWSIFGNKAKEGNEKAAQSTEESTVEMIARLDKQIEKLRERNALAESEPRIKNLTDLSDADRDGLARAKAALDANRAGTGEWANQSTTMRQLAEIDLLHNYETALKRVGQAQDEATRAAKRTKDADLKQWFGEHGTAAQRMEAELEGLRKKFGEIPPEMEKLVRAKYSDKGTSKKTEDAAKAAIEYAEGLRRERQELGLTEDQLTMLNAAREAAKAPTLAQKQAIIEEADALVKARAAAKAVADEKTRYTEAVKAQVDARLQEANAAQQAVDQAQKEIDTYGMGAEALTRYNIAKLEQKKLGIMETGSYSQAEIDHLDALIGKQKELLALQGQKDNLDSLFETDKVQSFGDALRNAFGEAGNGMAQLTNSLQDYMAKQDAADKARAKAKLKYAGDDKKIAREIAKIDDQQEKDRIGAYANMAGAAKSFFKENTVGYKVMEAAERGFRVYELAMNAQAIAAKLMGHGQVAASAVASAGTEVAANQAVGMSAAAVGVANQAKGDPYTAWARMAAMAAAMASIGFAVKGGGKSAPSLPEQRQKATGTGTVLGDKSAKSDSIAKAIAVTSQNSGIELSYTMGMLRALNSIDAKIGDFASLLVRTAGVNGEFGSAYNKAGPLSSKGAAVAGSLSGAAGGAMLGSFFGPLGTIAGAILGAIGGKFIGKIANTIFGGKQTVEDSGFTLGRTSMAAINAGQLSGVQYADIKKDGGWFHSDKRSTQTTSIGAEGNRQIAGVLQSMYKAVEEAGKLLKIDGDDFTQRLNAFVVDIGKISTKGLSGAEIEKQLQAAFSKVGDDLARFAVGGIEQFQKVGEGALETLARVASNYANIDSILASVGMTFGSVGMDSIAARESLVELAGGIDNLASQATSFADNFLTEAERLAPVQKYVTDKLAEMNLSFIDSRREFADYVLALNLTNEKERERYVALMDLQEAFAKVYSAEKDITKSAQEIADERADLQDQLDDLTMSAAQKLAKQRAALDASNHALFDQVQAATAAKEANDALRESMEKQVDTFGNAAKSLRDYGAGLMTGNLSTLTPAQQLAEAQKQYEDVASRALAGDESALGKFQSVADKFLQLSQQVNGGDSKYSADYAGVLAMIDKLAIYSDSRVDSAQAQIAALDRATEASYALRDTIAQQANWSGYADREGSKPGDVTFELSQMRAELKAQAEATQKLMIEAANMQRAATVQSGEKVAEAVKAPTRNPRKFADAELDY